MLPTSRASTGFSRSSKRTCGELKTRHRCRRPTYSCRYVRAGPTHNNRLVCQMRLGAR